jgi:flagellar motor protein MotB
MATAWSKAVPMSERPTAEVLELIRVSMIGRYYRLARSSLPYVLAGSVLLVITIRIAPHIIPHSPPPAQVALSEMDRYRSEFLARVCEPLGLEKVDDRCIIEAKVLFPSGQAELTAEGRSFIDELSKNLTKLTDSIPGDINWVLQVDGHTDNVPIKNSKFDSNWELSTARAVSVVRYLVDKRKMPRDRLVAAGYGEHKPRAEVDTEEGRTLNRRIELKLTNR